MKVVFLEDVPGTAKIGDIKEVKPGFARNYLLPRRLAMTATPTVIKSAAARATREAKLQDARDNEARGVAEKLEGKLFTIMAKSGSTGKLFGSVGAGDIAERIGDLLMTDFDKQNVLLPQIIKELGDYPTPVRLTRNVSATVLVNVIGEDGTTMADIKAKAGGAAAAEAAPADAPSGAEASAETEDEDAAEDEAADDDATEEDEAS